MKKQETHSKPSWKKATEEEKENYTKSLEDKLSSIEVPEGLSCSDVKCKDTNHCNDADEFITSVLECVESAASSSLPSPSPPSSSPTSRKPVPGWKDFVNLLKKRHTFGIKYGYQQQSRLILNFIV